jgi:tRNA CCA-adding enzyme
MPRLTLLREHILKQLRPTQSENEQVHKTFDHLKNAIERTIRKQKLEVSFICLEGSAGRKQTHLRNKKELDIFIGLHPSLIPKTLDRQKTTKSFIRAFLKKWVQDVALEAAILAGCKNTKIAYAEHPYVTTTLDGFVIDLVFCFDLPLDYILEKGPITAVDRTPHHSRFVDENLTITQRDDVRLLKSFFQTCWVYGDKSPVGRSGFTGFSAEILIYHWKNIENALNNLEQLQLEPVDYFERTNAEIKQHFQRDLLVIIDPTDSNRNAAASISERAFRYACNKTAEVLRNPSPEFFLPKAIPILSPQDEGKLESSYFVFEYQDETGWHYTKIRDKLYRYFTRLCQFLEWEKTREPRFGFSTFEEVFIEPNFAIALVIDHPKINPKYFRIGPPPHLNLAVRNFLQKHPSAILHNGRYKAEITRTFTSAKAAINHYLEKQPLTPKLRKIGVTHKGKTKTGKQALWILKNAVLPFIDRK